MSIQLVDRKLPVGKSEFEALIKDLSESYELPTADQDSIKFAVASIIMHLGPDDSHKSLEFFYKRLVAGAAKQVAHSVFQDIKLAQEARIKQEQEEATREAQEPASEQQSEQS